MFVRLKSGYNRDGAAFCHGLFLVLCLPETGPSSLMGQRSSPFPDNYFRDNVRAFVRFTKFRQLGHWMMGSCWVGPHNITLSGAYGNDGLVDTVPNDVWAASIPVPPDLVTQWEHGGGHNGSGREGDHIRKWGLDHINELRAVMVGKVPPMFVMLKCPTCSGPFEWRATANRKRGVDAVIINRPCNCTQSIDELQALGKLAVSTYEEAHNAK